MSTRSKEPFIKVGERVRFIGSGRHRRGDWPEGKWLEYGVTGTVTEYHPEQPAVRVRREYFEALAPYAVVRWDLGGAATTAIDLEDEGKRWERIEGAQPRAAPMTSSTGREGRCYELAWRHVAYQDEGTLVHGEVWSTKLGRMVDHAWVVTETGYLYEPVSDQYFNKDELYKTYRMKEITTYTPTEARKMALVMKNYGPWADGDRRKVLSRAVPQTAQFDRGDNLLKYYKVPPSAF